MQFEKVEVEGEKEVISVDSDEDTLMSGFTELTPDNPNESNDNPISNLYRSPKRKNTTSQEINPHNKKKNKKATTTNANNNKMSYAQAANNDNNDNPMSNTKQVSNKTKDRNQIRV